MLKLFNELVCKIREDDMNYFIENIEELKIWIEELKYLNTINSSAECKTIYYTLLELLEIIEDKQEGMDNDIFYLQCRFFDYVGIVRDKLKKIS